MNIHVVTCTSIFDRLPCCNASSMKFRCAIAAMFMQSSCCDVGFCFVSCFFVLCIIIAQKAEYFHKKSTITSSFQFLLYVLDNLAHVTTTAGSGLSSAPVVLKSSL